MARSTGRTRRRAGYQTNVFVNCPFDDEYNPFFRALLFVIQDCGFAVRCSLEIDDSGEARANKIVRLIKESALGIHDICRTELSEHNGLPRFNMPFELGIFVGLKNSENAKQRRKKILVLDKDRWRYQQFLSDIAGQDIRSHDNDVETLLRQVRHWLKNQSVTPIAGSQRIINRFRLFQTETPTVLRRLDLTEEDLKNYTDLHNLISEWIERSQ